MFELYVVIALLLPSFLNLPVSVLSLRREERQEKAQAFYKEAIRLLDNHDTEAGLANLRAACRLDNSSARYWNDLGVTEMRRGMLVKARERFHLALQIDPAFSVARKNLNDLLSFIESEQPDLLPEPSTLRMHHIFPVEVYSKKEFLTLSPEERELLREKPFLIKRFLSKYRLQSLFTLTNLRSWYPDVVVDYYPHNMVEEGSARPRFRTLSSALDQLTEPLEIHLDVDTSLPGTYIQWNMGGGHYDELLERMANLTASSNLAVLPAELDDHEDMKCFPSFLDRDAFYLRTHWKMMTVGEEGAGIFLHQDILLTSAYQVQLQGRKKWHLCPDSQSRLLYRAGDVDFFHPNYERFPLSKQASCFEVVVDAGDLLYYPQSYWHQTLNLDTPTISLSSSVITPRSVDGLIRELEVECQGERRIFEPLQPLCSNIAHCGLAWKERHSQESTFDEF